MTTPGLVSPKQAWDSCWSHRRFVPAGEQLRRHGYRRDQRCSADYWSHVSGAEWGFSGGGEAPGFS